MRHFKLRHPSARDIASFGGAAITGALIVSALVLPAPASQTLAAWVQAFGSIVAIAVAYMVGARQSRAAIEAVEATQRGVVEDRKRGLFAVVQAADYQADEIRLVMGRDVPREELPWVYSRVVTQRIARALESLPLYEIGADGGVAAILSMRDQFLLLEDALETYIAGPWNHSELKKTLDLYRRPEDYRELDRALETANKVLIHNVVIHLNRIRADYNEVRQAMFPKSSTDQ
ncbi:hypothetical protein [Luteibacter sp. 329MFSha]|uniref:hypothetical protein n=1 Tax=Luteibacter sp. 329MFSha TaxID=1798239 RepID=UPI0008CCD13D|nr:hypothetical protein [Luteibacter sp. 329MFSha]SEW25587.1 hypothetical protein SAMN04515660_3415 [Luteibacter sp. 329MFSha]